MAKVNGNNNVSAEYQIVNGKKVKKQEQPKNQKQVFNNKAQKTPQKPNDSAVKQEVYKKSGYQLKDTTDRGKIIQLKVNGKIRSYKTVGTLTTGGRILVQDEKGAYHVVSHTKDKQLVMLKDDYAKNKIFYENTSSEHKVKYGKKNYVITNAKRDRHGRMSAVDENGKRVVLSSDGKELKTSYVEAEDQKDNMNDYIAKATKGKSKAQADKIRQQILEGNSSYSNKGVLRFKASNGEVWYYDTKRKTYVKYADKEAQAIIKNLDKGATENFGLFRTSLGTDYELLRDTNAQIIDPEVLGKVNKHYSAEYGNKVDKNAQYGSGKYRTAYEAFLASEIGDDEVYQFNATLVKNNAIIDQSRRNEILKTNLTKIKSNGLGVSGRANRLAAADAASRKEDYQALQDAAEEELKKTNYKAPFKGSDALQTYIYGVNKGDVQEIDDFNTALIDPKEDMLDRDEVVKIKAETGALWAKQGKYDKAFESQDSEVVDKMFALQNANGKASLNVKELKAKAKGYQGEYLMFAKPELFTEQELADKAVQLLNRALDNIREYESASPYVDDTGIDQLKKHDLSVVEKSISQAYTLIRNDKVLNIVKQKMGDKLNLIQKKEQEKFGTNTFANITVKNDSVKSNLSAEQVAYNKAVVGWLKSQLEDLERDKKLNEQKEGWKQSAVNDVRTEFRLGETKASLANKYDLIKSNIARLEAAAEGKLVDKNGKPVSFEDAMKGLGETGIKALEQANQDYQSAQAKGEFVVDMAVLAIPIPGLSIGNIVRMAGTLYKVVGTTGKMYKVVKVTEGAVKGQKIINYVAKEMKTVKKATELAVKTVKSAEKNKKIAQLAEKYPKIAKAIKIADSSATGAMHMAGKTFALDVSNIATSREGFTSDRISEMNEKVKGSAEFGAMGGAIGGVTGVVANEVTSTVGKYVVHTAGLAADVTAAAGLITAESNGETNFVDNLLCINPDGSFNFEQASMTAMMIFGHLHGMSAVRGKVKPHVELQADGTFKAKLGDNVLTLNKDGIWSDSASGREFRLAENKNGKAELTELTKKEVAARHSEVPAEESHGTSTQQINSFKERINKAKTREELNAIRDDIKKTDLTVQERNELMAESLKVQREWSQAPERSHIVNMATEGEVSVMGKPELTALRQEVGIKQSKPGLHFEGETNGANTIINEMKGNDTVNSYIVSRDVEGKAHIEYKVSYENGKATDVEVYDTDGTIKSLPAEKKQAVLDELNKPAEADPASSSEAPAEESQVKETSTANDKNPVIASESEAIQPEQKTVETPAEPRFSESNINFSRTHEGFSQIEGNVKDVPDLRNADSFRNSKDGVGVVYLPKENATAIVVRISGRVNDNYTIMIDGKIPEEQCRALVKSLKDSGNNRFDRQQVADILNKQYEMAETSSVRPETHTEKSQAKAEPNKPAEKPAIEKQNPVIASESEAIQPEQKPVVENKGEREKPATGKKFNITTEDIPTKLSDMQEFVEKNNLNAVKNSDKDNVTSYSITNDETGGVIHIQFIDGKRSNMTVVKANDLQIHIEFAEDGRTPSKVRTDFIDNDKIYTRVEDRTTGQVTFEEPITYNGERSPIGLAIESDSPIAKRFNEGTIDLEGKFTPKEVNEGSYQVIEQNPEGKPTKTALKDTDGNVLEYNYNEYDSDGNVTKTTTRDVDGKVTASHDFEYDNNHNLTKETVKDAEGKITAIYDGEGNSLDIPAEKFAETNVESKPEPAKVEEGQKESVKAEDVAIDKKADGSETKKDAKTSILGNLLKKQKVKLDKEVEEGTKDIDNNQTSLTKKTDNGYEKVITDKETNIVRQRYYLDENGRNVKTELIDKNGRLYALTENGFTTEYKYADSGKVASKIVKDSNGHSIKEIEICEDGTIEYDGIDANGQYAKLTFKDTEGNVKKSTEYEYDTNGNVIKEIHKDAKGNITKEIHKDGKGNVKPQKESVTSKPEQAKVEEGQKESVKAEDVVTDKAEVSMEKGAEEQAMPVTPEVAQYPFTVTAEKVIVNGTEYTIPKTLEEAKNTLKHYGGSEYQIEDGNGNRVILIYDDNGIYERAVEETNKNGKALKDVYRNADGTIERTVDYDYTKDGVQIEIYKDANGNPTNINYSDKHISFDKEGNPSYKVNTNSLEAINKSIEQVFSDTPEIKGVLEKHGIKLVDKTTETKSIEEAKPAEENSSTESRDSESGIVIDFDDKPVDKIQEGQQPQAEPENTPDGFSKTPSKPKQLEKKTIEEILGDEKAPKTADDAKKYAEEHEEAEFKASDEPNMCDMLFLDKDHDNIIYYNQDGVQAYREYNPSEGVEQRDIDLYSDGTVSKVETRTVDGNLKVEAYDSVGNLTRKELYNNENEVWTAHQVYFDSEGNMTSARKAVHNKETESWEYTPEYEYNANDNVFELKKEGNVVSKVKYDEATEHWAEFDAEGNVVHEINKPEPVVESKANEGESATVESEIPEPQGETGEVDAGQAVSPEPVSTDNTTTPKKSMFDRLFHRNKAKNEDGTTIPKSLRGEDGTGLKEGIVYDKDSKQYKETIQEGNKTTTTTYDEKGRVRRKAEATTDSGSTITVTKDYEYNSKGKLVSEKESSLDGFKTTEYTKEYNLVHECSLNGKSQKLTIKYNDGYKPKVNGTEIASKEYTYEDGKFISKKDGNIVETVEYNQKDHTWTIKDANGKEVESHDNMKTSNKLRNTVKLASIAGAVGGIGYGIYQAVKSDNEQTVGQSQKTAKHTDKSKPNTSKQETKVTLGDSEGTISPDGTITIGGKTYPKNEDGTYTIDDKNYKLEDNKLVEVEPEKTDSTNTADSSDSSSGTQEVTGTIDGKNYSIKDGVVTIDGHDYEKDTDGYYHTEGGAIYGIGEDGKLVKIDKTTQTGNDSAQTGNDGNATQTGNDSAQTGNTDQTSQQTGNNGNSGNTGTVTQTGNTSTTGNNTHAPVQPDGNSGSAHNSASRISQPTAPTRPTAPVRPSEESRANSARHSEESSRTGNTPVTGVTEPTEAQKQVANTLQNEISGISTQADAQAFFTKLTSAVKNGQITIMQSDELFNLVKTHVETLVEADRVQDEISSETQPVQPQDEVATPAEPKHKTKREITPMERMELTEKIRKAKTRNDIANIQQEMRQYKVFQGRKNLRRAYKAKLRAFKHQGEPNAQKYNDKFDKRMEKIENSKVYNEDVKANNAEFMKQASIDEELRKKYRDFEA